MFYLLIYSGLNPIFSAKMLSGGSTSFITYPRSGFVCDLPEKPDVTSGHEGQSHNADIASDHNTVSANREVPGIARHHVQPMAFCSGSNCVIIVSAKSLSAGLPWCLP